MQTHMNAHVCVNTHECTCMSACSHKYIHTQTYTQMPLHMKHNTRQNIKQNTRQNIKQNTRQNTKQNTRQNIKQNTRQNIKARRRHIPVFIHKSWSFLLAAKITACTLDQTLQHAHTTKLSSVHTSTIHTHCQSTESSLSKPSTAWRSWLKSYVYVCVLPVTITSCFFLWYSSRRPQSTAMAAAPGDMPCTSSRTDLAPS